MSRQVRRVVLCALLLVLAAAGPAVNATLGVGESVGDASRVVSVDGSSLQPNTAQAAVNNSTVRHENPEEAGETGDLQGVESHLARLMAARLGESTIQISQGEYEQGRTLLGDEYTDIYGKYVDVTGETPSAGEGDAFESAAENQREFASTLEEYQETRSDYEQARENGNNREARQHARELVRLSGQLSDSGDELTDAYAGVENASGTGFDREEAIIQGITQNVSEETTELAAQTFRATSLSITHVGDSDSISFTDPLVVSGRLTTENGSAVASRTVRFAVGERTVTTETDGEGRVEFAYRPVRLPLSTEQLSVQYRPSASSVYLGSNATVPVAVSLTTADVSATGPSSASFSDDVTVRGRVVAADTGVPGVPVQLTLGDVVLGTITTNETGGYALTTALPAGVSAGETPITASVAQSDRAVDGDGTAAPMTVTPTETRLQLNATASTQRSIQVDGTLRTADGDSVPNQSVELRLAGSTIRDVETGADGDFSTRLSVPASLQGESNVTVVAVFSGERTNLNASHAQVNVLLRRAGGNSNDSGTVVPGGGDGGPAAPGVGTSFLQLPLHWVAGGALLLAVFGMVYALHRGSEPSQVDANNAATTSTAADTTTADEPGPLALAAEQYANGDIRATVELAFATVRRHVERRDGLASTLTAREFVEQYASGDKSDRAAITELAALYEHAAFGGQGVPEELGTTALSLARSVVGEDEGSTPASPDD
ncbi:DUF4129 domain-containing protein [Halorarum halophilum]|uniref:DUF4129 domain-containing protein n=1 Tax=Halorarum halophilum TaxID=2743090 RepID=A0A7D5K7J5_9EURY|nr:DUF4129 domain-containing protein [Halobaculum halophilum]QLG27434.1 DUF4129 domain-containing protein [Halobaculum halophilum]